MTYDEALREKGLAVTQIELWQQRLKVANELILKYMREESKPKLTDVDSQSS